MPIILKYPISHHQKYEYASNEGLEAGALFYEHINKDSTVAGLSYQDIFTIRANDSACKCITITQKLLRVKL